MRSLALIPALLLIPFLSSMAQDIQKESGLKETGEREHSPKRAALWSAVIPGAGQVYNHKAWKVPIIYAGFAATGYAVWFNQQEYQKFREELSKRGMNQPGDPQLKVYNTDQVVLIKNYYRRNRDLSYIIGVGLYGMTILDAYVDAHLKEFDISDKLSMGIGPDGVGLNWNLNR